jgi:hypothetical protein
MKEGQLIATTELGKFLEDFALARTDLKTFVEIGTWNGMGSTLQIARSLEKRSDGSYLTTFETDPAFVSEAQRNRAWSSEIVKFVHGRISDRMMSFEEVEKHPCFIPVHMKIWHRNDLHHFEDSPLRRDALPENVDFILFDGSEFSTIGDWEFAKTLKPRVVALSCTRVMKTRDIFEELSGSPEWKLLESGEDKQGWAAFESVATVLEPKPSPEPEPISDAVSEPVPDPEQIVESVSESVPDAEPIVETDPRAEPELGLDSAPKPTQERETGDPEDRAVTETAETETSKKRKPRASKKSSDPLDAAPKKKRASKKDETTPEAPVAEASVETVDPVPENCSARIDWAVEDA